MQYNKFVLPPPEGEVTSFGNEHSQYILKHKWMYLFEIVFFVVIEAIIGDVHLYMFII